MSIERKFTKKAARMLSLLACASALCFSACISPDLEPPFNGSTTSRPASNAPTGAAEDGARAGTSGSLTTAGAKAAPESPQAGPTTTTPATTNPAGAAGAGAAPTLPGAAGAPSTATTPPTSTSTGTAGSGAGTAGTAGDEATDAGVETP